jgi:hypothetical protein
MTVVSGRRRRHARPPLPGRAGRDMLAALLLVSGALTLFYVPVLSTVSQLLAIALGIAHIAAAVLCWGARRAGQMMALVLGLVGAATAIGEVLRATPSGESSGLGLALLSGLMATAILWLAWTSWPPRAVR